MSPAGRGGGRDASRRRGCEALPGTAAGRRGRRAPPLAIAASAYGVQESHAPAAKAARLIASSRKLCTLRDRTPSAVFTARRRAWSRRPGRLLSDSTCRRRIGRCSRDRWGSSGCRSGCRSAQLGANLRPPKLHFLRWLFRLRGARWPRCACGRRSSERRSRDACVSSLGRRIAALRSRRSSCRHGDKAEHLELPCGEAERAMAFRGRIGGCEQS